MASDVSVNRPRVKLELLEGTLMAAALMAALVAGVLLNPPPSLQGWVLLAVNGGTVLALFYVLRGYLQSQWSLRVDGELLIVARWWDRPHSAGERRIPLVSIRRFVLRQPVELAIEESEVLRLGTFWWRQREFAELSVLASWTAIPIQKERPELPTWLGKRSDR
jgi:hypothetical protein